MNFDSILDWSQSCVSVVLALALIGVGIAVVRPARPTAGWLVTAAGAVDLLSTCCFRAMDSLQEAEHFDPMIMSLTSRALGTADLAVYLGLLTAAAAMLTPAPSLKSPGAA